MSKQATFSLSDECRRHKIQPKAARRRLREAGEKKPREGWGAIPMSRRTSVLKIARG